MTTRTAIHMTDATDVATPRSRKTSEACGTRKTHRSLRQTQGRLYRKVRVCGCAGARLSAVLLGECLDAVEAVSEQ